MIIDWSTVAMIVGPIVGAVVLAMISRAIEKRPRLVTYLGHVSSHRVTPGSGDPFYVFTHSVVLKNVGGSSAHNVRLTHSVFPDVDVHPNLNYEIQPLPGGGTDIVIPVVVPRQEITVSYLYNPPVTWDQINGPIRSNEGLARVLTVLPMRKYPNWVNRVAAGVMLIGIVALIYLVVYLINAIIALIATIE